MNSRLTTAVTGQEETICLQGEQDLLWSYAPWQNPSRNPAIQLENSRTPGGPRHTGWEPLI